MQAIDGLKTSQYLVDTAIRNIEGDISIDEAGELLNCYYEENPKSDNDDRTEEADNRSMHISRLLKADIEDAKANIEDAKVDIEKLLMNIDEGIKSKTVMHVISLYEECGKDNIFGRSFVEKVTGLKSTRASEIIKLMMENDVIETVKGQGKGKYRFK